MDKTQQNVETKQILAGLDSEIALLKEELELAQEVKSKEGQKEVLQQEIDKLS